MGLMDVPLLYYGFLAISYALAREIFGSRWVGAFFSRCLRWGGWVRFVKVRGGVDAC